MTEPTLLTPGQTNTALPARMDGNNDSLIQQLVHARQRQISAANLPPPPVLPERTEKKCDAAFMALPL